MLLDYVTNFAPGKPRAAETKPDALEYAGSKYATVAAEEGFEARLDGDRIILEDDPGLPAMVFAERHPLFVAYMVGHQDAGVPPPPAGRATLKLAGNIDRPTVGAMWVHSSRAGWEAIDGALAYLRRVFFTCRMLHTLTGESVLTYETEPPRGGLAPVPLVPNLTPAALGCRHR